jgi:hypothetical protein
MITTLPPLSYHNVFDGKWNSHPIRFARVVLTPGESRYRTSLTMSVPVKHFLSRLRLFS